MKRNLLVLLLLIAMASALSACDAEDLFVPMEYTVGMDDVQDVSIDVRDRRIEVSPSDDNQIHVYYFESSKEGYVIDIVDGRLSVSGASNKEWMDFIGRKPSADNRRISLQIPEIMLDRISLQTTNEDILIREALSAEDISLSSNGGNILFGNLDAGKSITLDVKNGNISGSIIGRWDDFSILCDTKKGDCNLPSHKDGGEKMLNVKANNGDVVIEFVGR